jgi:hypothetical protein
MRPDGVEDRSRIELRPADDAALWREQARPWGTEARRGDRAGAPNAVLPPKPGGQDSVERASIACAGDLATAGLPAFPPRPEGAATDPEALHAAWCELDRGRDAGGGAMHDACGPCTETAETEEKDRHCAKDDHDEDEDDDHRRPPAMTEQPAYQRRAANTFNRAVTSNGSFDGRKRVT